MKNNLSAEGLQRLFAFQWTATKITPLSMRLSCMHTCLIAGTNGQKMPPVRPSATHKHTLQYAAIQKKIWSEWREPQPSKRTTCLSLGGSELWLVVFHAAESLRAPRCPHPIENLKIAPHNPKVPTGFPSPLPSTLLGGFEPMKAKTMYNGPPLPPMIWLWSEWNMGEEGDERERVGGRGRWGERGDV